MSDSVYKPIYKVEAGDRFVGWGPGWVASEDARFVGSSDLGDAKDRQHFEVVWRNVETGDVRTLPGTGHSKVHVLERSA